MKSLKLFLITIVGTFVFNSAFAQPAWVTSGAPIGDTSTYVYPTSWVGVSLTMVNPSFQDSFIVSNITNNPAGIHIYAISRTPNSFSGLNILQGNDRYFGVFLADTSVNSSNYDMFYHYQNNPFVTNFNDDSLTVFYRLENDSLNWTPSGGTNNLLMQRIYNSSEIDRGEYILGTVIPPTCSVNLGLDASICDIDSFQLSLSPVWDSISWSNGIVNDTVIYASISGQYSVYVRDSLGCVARDTVQIIVNPTYNIPQIMSICQGDSALLGGVYQSTAGVYYDSLITVLTSCDSVIVTTLTINPIYNIPQSAVICQGDSLLAGGSYQSIAGVYYDSLMSLLTGCDSVIITTLSINLTYNTLQNAVICQGDSILLGGAYQSVAGTYSDTLTTVLTGCDSVIVTTLIANPTFNIPQIMSICQGDSALLGGGYQLTAGIYYDSLVAFTTGCDSVIVTTLTVTPSYSLPQSVTICQGDSLFVGGAYQSTAGVYYDSLTTVLAGCDSVTTTTLSVLNTSSSSVTVSSCSSFISPSGNFTWTSSGIYIDTVSNSLGCDSVITVNLIISPPSTSSISPTVCANQYVSPSGSYTWTNSGVYTDTLSSLSGCDSVITINLTIAQTPIIDAVPALCIDDAVINLQANVPNGIWSGLGIVDSVLGVFEPFIAGVNTTIIYTINNGTCSVSDSVTIIIDSCKIVIPNYYVPNVFSPNNDGQNDILYVLGKEIREFEFLVFDKWGELIFESTNLSIGWDGTFHGKIMIQDIYIYTIKGSFNDGNLFETIGKITLLR